MSDEYLYKTALETICYINNLNYKGIVEGVKLLNESQETTGDFIDWNSEFCSEHGIFAPAEMDFYYHVLIFLYLRLGKCLKSNGVECEWLEFKDMELEAMIAKVQDWDDNYFLRGYMKDVPFENRTMLEHWFYAKLTDRH